MSRFYASQFSLSTAEAEQNLFTGDVKPVLVPSPTSVMPAGRYRVIDGELVRIVDAAPPFAASRPR